jgi:hypothetical protein
MPLPRTTISSIALAALLQSAWAGAQQGPSVDAPPGSVVVPSEGGDVVVTPGSTTVTNTMISPYGFPQPGDDINPGLPSSSRPTTDTSRASDGFDLGRGGREVTTLRGNEGSPGVIGGRSVRVPDIHTVRRGDTLWDLSAYYYEDPYQWPRLWGNNPQLTNPHWIYPGDQLRMRRAGGGGAGGPGSRAGLGQSVALTGTGAGGFPDRGAGGLPVGTVFLRQQAYMADPKRDVWGELIGAREDQLLLADGNYVYLQMRPGVDLKLGQQLTIFRPLRKPAKVPGARMPPGQIIAIKGTVRVDQWDPKNRLARGEIVESVDVIERGNLIGPVGRRFDVVPPKPATVTLWARVLTGIYPHVFVAQNQIVFIDRGSDDGLSAGNRLFIVRRGDTWRRTLEMAKDKVRDQVQTDAPGHAEIERTPLKGNEKKFPDEVLGELRILRANKQSSVTVVVSSHREIVPGDRAVVRKGY